MLKNVTITMQVAFKKFRKLLKNINVNSTKISKFVRKSSLKNSQV